ncbi:MAG: PilT/PilU family type 4a pilus ATPase [Lentisphaeria bacterium]
MDIATLCMNMNAEQASDLFLNEDQMPAIRCNGIIKLQHYTELLQQNDIRQFFSAYLPPDTWEKFQTNRDLDLGFTLEKSTRFRLNLSFQKGKISLSIRRVPNGKELDLTKLRIPEKLAKMIESPRGLLLITGATGSGKTTTLAALLNHINCTQKRHIITIEDPIEFIHENNLALITQREIGNDTHDFPTALKYVIRQNPDAIFIGELRDLDTLSTAISAAMTGHLVAATIHTVDVQQTLERILNYFPDHLQNQIAQDLSLALLGIVSQRLLPGIDGKPVCAFEILKNTPLVQRLIAKRSLDSIPDILRNSTHEGMIDFNHSLLALCKQNLIAFETAKYTADNSDEFTLLYQGMQTGVRTLQDTYSSDADQGLSIKRLLSDAVQYGASDLLLTVNSPPVIRLNGFLRPFDTPVLASADTHKLFFSILSPQQRSSFEIEREIDFALSVRGIGDKKEEQYRFRVNGFFQKGKIAAAFRLIPTSIPSADKLGLPETIVNLSKLQQGLILVTGPTGHGKSTTQAALIDKINQTRACHIITIEDPIEFVHSHKVALVEQREVYEDTKSFGAALKYVLRQDPDVILIGEMRDTETVSAALTAAETGHLVLATLHTNDVTQSVDRIIDLFPSDRQNQIRSQLAASLQAIISQRLLPTPTKNGRVAAFEILLGSTAVRSMIRDKKTHQLAGTMEASARMGMITMERAVQNLYLQQKITRETLENMGYQILN